MQKRCTCVHVILNSHVGLKKKKKHYNVLKFEKHSMIVFLTNAAATKLDTCQSAFE